MPLAAEDELVQERVFLAAGPYLLEGELAYAETAAAGRAVVVAGPHPLLGGSMDNNVVRGLAEGLARRGVPTLRFNYRGVGGSGGPVVTDLAGFWSTSHAEGEGAYRDDLIAAVGFLRSALGGGAQLALAGYSFGCSLLPQASPEGVPLVLVAPTIALHDHSPYCGRGGPLLVVASEDDFAAPAERVQAWCDTLPQPRAVVRGLFDNHFFRGHEEWLAEVAFTFLEAYWSDPSCS